MKQDALAALVRDSRKALGLSQMELARGCGLSLPFIQQIEGSRANPSLASMNALLSVFGIELEAVSPRADWSLLASLGAPVLEPSEVFGSEESHAPRGTPRAELLIRELRAACLELSHDEQVDSRKKEALQALIAALHDGYPSWYREHFGRAPLIERFRPSAAAANFGRLIKLRRICLARLAEYL